MRPAIPPPSAYAFPPPESGHGELGVVAVGGDFAPGTILTAYRQGIFPWPMGRRGVVAWCSPDPRALFPLERALGKTPPWSRSLRRALRTRPFRITVDRAFADVMAGCADREEGTWITPTLAAGYRKLHALGWAHSLEVWTADGALVGGIYGVAVGAYFSAESMFHRVTDASKIAFVRLVEHLARRGYTIFDAQVPTPHLITLGVEPVARRTFLARHRDAVTLDVTFT